MADTCVRRDVRSARPAASRGGVNGQHPKQAADVRAHDYDYEDVHLTEHRMLQVLAEVRRGGGLGAGRHARRGLLFCRYSTIVLNGVA